MSFIFPDKKDDYNIGVISDTHGLLRTEAIKELYGSDFIIHAGDIGNPDIITRLKETAPVVAIRGNVDTPPMLYKFPFTETIEIGKHIIFVIHNIGGLEFNPEEEGIDIVIYGHSHKALIEKKGKVLYFNPGSAGKKRFNFPLTIGKIKIKNDKITGKIVNLLLE